MENKTTQIASLNDLYGLHDKDRDVCTYKQK